MLKLIESVEKAVTPVLAEIGFELVDVEFGKKYGQDNLTLYVYTEGGVTLDDCEKVHYAVGPIVDEITDDKPYVLNISSPGLDRPFKTQRDFERNYGKEVEVKLYMPLKGKKHLEGFLLERGENTTTIRMPAKGKEPETELNLENSRIALVRPLVKFE